jgi:catechol-2,3-dioxygenase
LDDKIVSDKDGIDKLKEIMFVLEHKLRERENLIKSMKNELEKYFLDDRTNAKEIYIADPDRNNLELYNELNHSKELFHKMSKLLTTEKVRVQNLESSMKVEVILT